MKKVFFLVHSTAREHAVEAVRTAPDDYCVSVSEKNRSLQQNAAQWPILEAFSQQLLWPVNGLMVKMTEEEWKDVLSAAFKQETARLALGLNGGVVMLGARTSNFGKKEFSEWLEFLNAVAAQREIDIKNNERAANGFH